jgi:hypothetical protein
VPPGTAGRQCVIEEWGPPVYAETPRRIRLVGPLGEPQVSSLEMYCTQLEKTGQTELLVDVDGVTDCDAAGLRGLLALSAHTGIAVAVEGARWSQFTHMLNRVPIAEVQRLCDDVRTLVVETPPARNSPGRPGLSRA